MLKSLSSLTLIIINSLFNDDNYKTLYCAGHKQFTNFTVKETSHVKVHK